VIAVTEVVVPSAQERTQVRSFLLLDRWPNSMQRVFKWIGLGLGVLLLAGALLAVQT
jgi:hypothetical protein